MMYIFFLKINFNSNKIAKDNDKKNSFFSESTCLTNFLEVKSQSDNFYFFFLPHQSNKDFTHKHWRSFFLNTVYFSDMTIFSAINRTSRDALIY